VLPLSAVCQAVGTWARCIGDNNAPPLLRANHHEQGSSYHGALGRILNDIRKSNLLGRLLYAKQPLRTKPCPTHHGHMDSQELITGEGGCPCQGTGWLPEAPGTQRYTGNVFLATMDRAPDGSSVLKNITPKT